MQKGAVLIESAIVLPFFILLLFAMIDIGWVLYTKQAMTLTASSGARLLAMSGQNPSEVKTYVQQNLRDLGLKPKLFNVTAKDENPLCKKPLGFIEVSIQADMQKLSIMGDPFGLLNRDLNTRITLFKECNPGRI